MILHVRLLLSTTPNLPFLSLSYQSLMAKVLEEYPIISALDLRKKNILVFLRLERVCWVWSTYVNQIFYHKTVKDMIQETRNNVVYIKHEKQSSFSWTRKGKLKRYSEKRLIKYFFVEFGGFLQEQIFFPGLRVSLVAFWKWATEVTSSLLLAVYQGFFRRGFR